MWLHYLVSCILLWRIALAQKGVTPALVNICPPLSPHLHATSHAESDPRCLACPVLSFLFESWWSVQFLFDLWYFQFSCLVSLILILCAVLLKYSKETTDKKLIRIKQVAFRLIHTQITCTRAVSACFRYRDCNQTAVPRATECSAFSPMTLSQSDLILSHLRYKRHCNKGNNAGGRRLLAQGQQPQPEGRRPQPNHRKLSRLIISIP